MVRSARSPRTPRRSVDGDPAESVEVLIRLPGFRIEASSRGRPNSVRSRGAGPAEEIGTAATVLLHGLAVTAAFAVATRSATAAGATTLVALVVGGLAVTAVLGLGIALRRRRGEDA